MSIKIQIFFENSKISIFLLFYIFYNGINVTIINVFSSFKVGILEHFITLAQDQS